MSFRIARLCLVPALMAATAAHASPYVAPKVGTAYHFQSSLSGEGVSEVVSSEADRYGVSTVRPSGERARGFRLFGIWYLGGGNQEGIGAGDAWLVRKLFPLQVGNQASFNTYGSSESRNWTRRHHWQVKSERSVDLGSGPERMFAISLLVEHPDFYKFEGTCDYLPRLAVCLRLSGDQFVYQTPRLTGRQELIQTKVVIDGVETVIPKLFDPPSQQAPQKP